MMNGDCYDDQYPVNGTLDIESRAQRDEVESKEHGVTTEAVYARLQRAVASRASPTRSEKVPRRIFKNRRLRVESAYAILLTPTYLSYPLITPIGTSFTTLRLMPA